MRTRLLLALITAVVLAACGTAGDTDEAADAPTDGDANSATTPQEDATTDTEEAPDAPGLAVATTELGEVLVDGDGMTLYLFDPDAQGESTCTDACAASWPPLVGDDPTIGDGVDESLVGAVTRDDGSTQVTYDGWPLYRWAADTAPGDVDGQGVNDVWWVLAADGSANRTTPDDEEDEGSSYGY